MATGRLVAGLYTKKEGNWGGHCHPKIRNCKKRQSVKKPKWSDHRSKIRSSTGPRSGPTPPVRSPVQDPVRVLVRPPVQAPVRAPVQAPVRAPVRPYRSDPTSPSTGPSTGLTTGPTPPVQAFPVAYKPRGSLCYILVLSRGFFCGGADVA